MNIKKIYIILILILNFKQDMLTPEEKKSLKKSLDRSKVFDSVTGDVDNVFVIKKSKIEEECEVAKIVGEMDEKHISTANIHNKIVLETLMPLIRKNTNLCDNAKNMWLPEFLTIENKDIDAWLLDMKMSSRQDMLKRLDNLDACSDNLRHRIEWITKKDIKREKSILPLFFHLAYICSAINVNTFKVWIDNDIPIPVSVIIKTKPNDKF